MTAVKTLTNLPLSFVNKPVSPIQNKRDYKPSFRSLPFVAGWRSKTKTPYWNVPATGGYFGGYETGAAMATAFLKFIRSSNKDVHGYLPWIVDSFARRIEQEGGSEMADRRYGKTSESYDSLRGQYVGFFNTLASALLNHAKTCDYLDGVSERELVASANAGLGFDQSAYMASLSEQGEE